MVQKYQARREAIAAIISATAAWQLDPQATDQQKAAREAHFTTLRKFAKSSEAEYIQCLVMFQYGADNLDLISQADSTSSLLPPELRKKLETRKKEDAKLKSKTEAEKDKKSEDKGKYYGGSSSYRYRSPYKRSTPYSPFPQFLGGSEPGPFTQRSTYNSEFPPSPFRDPGRNFQYPHNLGAENLNQTSVFKPHEYYPTHSPDRYSRNYYGDSRELQIRKANTRCGNCDEYGHWHRDNVCKPEDVARKLAKLQAQDPQFHAAAEMEALRLTHVPQGN